MHDIWGIIFWVAFGLLAYAQILYPILVIAIAKGKHPKTEERENHPQVSLIIPAHNEEAVLEAKIQNTLSIDYPSEKLEILVASDGSQDGTNEIARKYTEEGVTLLEFSQRRGKASAVNDAVAAASGDVLCLCDANVMFRFDALKALVQRLADPGVGAVTGDVRLASDEANFGEGEEAYYGIEKRLQYAESQLSSVIGVDGGMYVVRRSLYKPLAADTILDDFVTSVHVMNQDARVVYEPAAIATESGTPTAKQEYRRRVRVSAGAVQSIKRGQWPSARRPVLFWQYLSHKVLRWLGPVWLVLMFVGNLALYDEGLLYQVALIGQATFYAVSLLAAISLPLRSTRLGGIAFYFVMSHVAIADGLIRGLFNRQKVTWAQAERPSDSPNQQSVAVN